MNQYEEFARKKNQLNYRQMLDQQVNVKNAMKMYGNMSSVEKAMNRHDLHAYKNYDNNQYALIPGVTSNKVLPGQIASPGAKAGSSPPQKKPATLEEKFHKKVNTLAQLGYNNAGVSATGQNVGALSEFAGRNFQGQKQYKSILDEYN